MIRKLIRIGPAEGRLMRSIHELRERFLSLADALKTSIEHPPRAGTDSPANLSGAHGSQAAPIPVNRLQSDLARTECHSKYHSEWADSVPVNYTMKTA